MQLIKVKILTDTRTSAVGFVSAKLIYYYHLSVIKLAQTCRLKLADDKLVLQVTYCAQVWFQLRDHFDEL